MGGLQGAKPLQGGVGSADCSADGEDRLNCVREGQGLGWNYRGRIADAIDTPP